MSKRTMFKPSSWIAKVELINRLLVNNSLMAIMATKSGGKTSFISLLQEYLDPSVDALLIPDDCLTLESIARYLSSNYLQCDSVLDFSLLIGQVNNHRKHLLLIIDNAENLSPVVLQQFLECTKGDECYLHLCLVGTYALNENLHALPQSLLEQGIHSVLLGPLSAQESKTYVLSTLDLPRSLKVSEQDLNRFYTETKGEMAAINAALPTFFSPTKSNNNSVEKICYTSCFFLVFACLFYIWQNSSYVPYLSKLSTKEQPNNTKNTKKTKNTQLALSAIPLSSFIAPWTLASVKKQVQPPPLKHVVLLEEGERDEPGTTAVMDSIILMPKTLQKFSLLGNNRDHNPKTERTTKVAQVSFIQSIAGLKSKNSPIKANAIPVKKPYTIQILASKREKVLRQFLKDNNLDATLYRTQKVTKNGIKWYVLTVGQFENRNAALGALQKLPTPIQAIRPWVRTT